MTEGQKPYFDAFYGDALPTRLHERIEEEFLGFAAQLKKDIWQRWPTIEYDSETHFRLVLVGLQALRENGLTHPGGYEVKIDIVAKAFMAIKKEYKYLQEREEALARAHAFQLNSDDQIRDVAKESKIKARLLVHYEGAIKKNLADGLDSYDAHVMGFIDILNENRDIDRGGIEYFLLGTRIPDMYGIYEDQRIIDATNSHPVLFRMERERSFMAQDGRNAFRKVMQGVN